ncbi:hypothetical protein [Deinococcus sonorensis]|uniref:M-like protein n=2 Tax=Deinococcus sonorensis TaxID=309891 RepID=A0AAU7U8W3_9DEIO
MTQSDKHEQDHLDQGDVSVDNEDLSSQEAQKIGTHPGPGTHQEPGSKSDSDTEIFDDGVRSGADPDAIYPDLPGS